MSKSKKTRTIPRSIRQKQILDVAADNPDLTMEAIADEVPSASLELVERVLNEYGDPAEDESDDSQTLSSESKQEENIPINLNELPSKQRELLRLIVKYPRATQRELGEKLGVSRTTVSNRANAIDGFQWNKRLEFVEANMNSLNIGNEESRMLPDDDESRPSNDKLIEHIESIERQIEELTAEVTACSMFNDPSLTHKVVHACMKSETITQEEELRVLKCILEQ